MSDIGQEDFRVELDGGKYTVIYLVGGGTRWLRHGEPWDAAQQSFQHSKVITSMLHRIHDLEVQLHQKVKGDAAEVGQRASHYGAGIQPWDYIVASGWAPEFAAGNALKYVRRYQNKNGEDDLKKGRWYYAELVKLATENYWAQSKTVLDRLEIMLTPEERQLLRHA